MICELNQEPVNIWLILKNGHLLFVYVIVSEAKLPESNNFGFLLLALLKIFLATKLGEFSSVQKYIF